MIDRRSLVVALAGGAIARAFAADAQPKDKAWRVGYIGIAPVGTSPESERLVGIFLKALGEKSFVVGKNLVFERRATEGRNDRAPALVAELISLRVDVLVVATTAAIRAAKDATTTIPIVMMNASDPVASGLVASLARPGGNVTGVTDFEDDLSPKRLELLKAAAPKAIRIAFVQEAQGKRPDAATADALNKEYDAAAQTLGIGRLLRVPLTTPQDFDAATAAIVSERADALLVGGSSASYAVRKEMADFAIRQRLPLMVSSRNEGSAGALMSYGPDYADNFRKAATYVAKILNGTKPADLPVERPTKLELIVNLKTAKAIGLTIPQLMLLRADEVIE